MVLEQRLNRVLAVDVVNEIVLALFLLWFFGIMLYMPIKIIQYKITLQELKQIAKSQFVDLVKAVVDIEKEIMAVGGELHADEEVLLSEKGSKRQNTWGINIYPEKSKEDWIEFDSLINIKPQCNNRSRDVEDENIREKIKSIVNKLIQ